MMQKQTVVLLSLCMLSGCFLFSIAATAQSPEISLREFASGQIKKGVRSIGMGGNGATWGNYSLVWRDSGTALIDAGATSYTNHNSFSFTAAGITTPALWHGLTIYAIELSQYAANVATSLKSPGLGSSPVLVHGDGNNQALFIKAAMPLSNGFSVGVLLSYERSQFSAVSDNSAADDVRYHTNWVPSGGFGITWQPNKRILAGFRALFNNDMEYRTDNTGTSKGLNAVQEYRLGVSVGLWDGALADLGGNLRAKSNKISKTSATITEPNLGFEQVFLHRHLALRTGVDETSYTAGFSVKFQPVSVDVAYVNNIGIARVGDLFGTASNSVIATFVFNYGALKKRK